MVNANITALKSQCIKVTRNLRQLTLKGQTGTRISNIFSQVQVRGWVHREAPRPALCGCCRASGHPFFFVCSVFSTAYNYWYMWSSVPTVLTELCEHSFHCLWSRSRSRPGEILTIRMSLGTPYFIPNNLFWTFFFTIHFLLTFIEEMSIRQTMLKVQSLNLQGVRKSCKIFHLSIGWAFMVGN